MKRPRRRTSDSRARSLVQLLLAAPAAVALVLGGWGALSLVGGSADVERASLQLAAYRQALAEVRAEASALAEHDREESGIAAAGYLRARRVAAEALAAAERLATSDDERRLAASLAGAHGEHAGEAPSAADAERARSQAQLLEARLEDVVADAASRTLELAAAERRPQRLALAGLPVGVLFALGALLLPATRRRRLERRELRRMAHAALTDSLTGLRNHRAFHEDIRRAIQHRDGSRDCFSLLMVDLDGLKQINDTLGHQAGDDHIKEAGDLLRAAVRGTDAAYRTGGDEFMVILPGERSWKAIKVAQRLHELASGPGTRVSLTAGVAESTGDETTEMLIRRADLALYEAKRSGRKTVVYSADLAPSPAKPRSALVRPDHSAQVAAALARAVDARDPATRAHCETVSELCALLATQLGLDEKTIARLRLAGLLHDVGQIGIPGAILQKASPLDPAERAVIETHPVIGESIVAAAGFLEEAQWIRHHHERFGGRGYPQGLRGSDIPLESRIILVADAFEAITAGRPYRPALSTEAALAELVRNAGTQLDPDCVGALHRALVLEELDPLVQASRARAPSARHAA